MPTIKRFANCAIAIYAEDHNPPHFHLRGSDFEILVAIADGTVVGKVGRARDVAEALAWAKANRALLQAKWDELNPGR